MTATLLLPPAAALGGLAGQVAADLFAGRDRRVVAPGGYGKTRFAAQVITCLEAADSGQLHHLPDGQVVRRRDAVPAALLGQRSADDAGPSITPGELDHRTGGVARFVHVLLDTPDADA